ncbi:MAG: PKD domain-containing protein [Bacteroidota bacterium]
MKKAILLRLTLILCLFFSFENLYAQPNVSLIASGCIDEPATLLIDGDTAPFDINWGDGFTQTVNTDGSYSYFYDFPGTFEILITDAQGDSVVLFVDIIPCFIDLFGNFEPCQGDCEVYDAVGGGFGINWQIEDANGNTVGSGTDFQFTYCWDVPPGDYTIIVDDFVGQIFIYEVQVLAGSVPLDIVSLANTFCQADSLNPSSCEKICANSTAIYTIPTAQNVTWEVLGADSWTPNGNQVEVEWGAPGSGSVSATASGGTPSDLGVDCSSQMLFGINGITFGGSATVTGGTPPYTYNWSSPNGFTSNEEWFNITPASPDNAGPYLVVVTDAIGNTASCEVIVDYQQTLGGECLVTYYGNVTNASNCANACDGSISFNISDADPQATYTYLWSTGSTTPAITGLCPGEYTVTAVEDNTTEPCMFVQTYTVGCNSTSGPTCPSTSTICVDILEDPDAAFSTIPAAVNGAVNICEGGTVVFNNESVGASIFEWNFGNGNVSTAVNTEQTYPTAGTYEVYLISRNDCYCGDTTFLTVEVADAISPTLDCVGTICENTTVTYTTGADCGAFDWLVTGDYVIQDGGGADDDFITIEWLTGPEGIIELSVSGCATGNYCLEPTVEVVPIISDNAVIKGPEKVCRLDEATYFIDDYSATDFVWTVSSGGEILEGQNSSSIKVRWEGSVSPNAPQWVAVDYDNCYLGCGGSDTKDVFILPDFYIEGPIEVCENEMSTHVAKKDIAGLNDVDCDWTVTASNGTVVWTSTTPTDEINLDWNTIAAGAGRYAIRAIPTDPLEVCTDHFTSYINLVAPPTSPTSIAGTTQICPGTVYTYEVNSSNPNYVFNWTINDGGNITNATGKVVNVSFGNTPPYILSVTQTSTDGLACESSALDLEVFPLPNFTATGDDQVCEESEATYTADFFENVTYEWTINPADAGTVVSGQNTNTVQVFWHQGGSAALNVTLCGMTETIPVTIISKPDPIITGDLFVCPSESTTVGVASTYATYLWKTEAGATLANTPTVDVPAGAYELVVTDNFGCENNVAFEVVGYPQPEVSISVFGSWGRCYLGNDPDPPAELQATEVPAGFTYQWYQDNVPIPNSNSSVITTSDFGNFNVAVIDQNGCETFSKVVTLFELCNFSGGVCNNPSLPGLDCEQGTDVQVAFTATNACDVFDFSSMMSPDMVSGTATWNFDDPASGANNTSTSDNPTHQFSNAGHYIVTLIGLNSQGLECWDSKLVTVPISPNFNHLTACAGESMEFEDLTGFLPNETVQGWSWDFGDPASGTNNTSTDQNPTHIFSTSGTYNVTLTASHNSGCTASITKQVTVETPPTVTFDQPVENCQGSALSFVAQPSADVLFYEWNFGDPVSGDANTSEVANPFHEFGSPGDYMVTCTVTDVWGCTDVEALMITVAPNPLNGAISFSIPSPICDGDVTTLTAPTGGTAWEWSDGSTTESITTGEAGAYVVTITDDNGCTHVADPVVLDIIALPTATIQAVEYDEFGQPVNVFYDNYSTCEGEDVFLQVVENANYTYTWSDGTGGHVLEYSEDRGNLLEDGTYSISLEVVDNTTGCSNTVGPFNLVVHPTPVDIQISSNPASPICENTITTISVDNPSVDLTYVWNTGEIGTSIEVSAAGDYFVRGITVFGCSAESNTVEISSGPDIKKIPDGCHSRCKPDTICLPTINGVAGYQWYLDGNPIAGPNGTTADFVAFESGAYHVVMTDNLGCTTTSDILNLDLFDGFGTFTGNVYMDVNENGIIDGLDTLLSGIDVILSENGTALDTVTSAQDGSYAFENILATAYNLQVDINGLPTNVVPVWNNLDSALVGCDDMENVDWLLQVVCPTTIQSFNGETCFGESYIFDGTIVPPGVPTDFTYSDINGCDSIVTVTVTQLQNYNFTTSLAACDGNDVTYNGTTLTAGSTTQFPLVSPEGCNYFETVEVIPFPTNDTNIELEICAGEPVIYNGQQVNLGVTEFTFTNQFGCDSTVFVNATQLPEIQFDIQTNEPCWNSSDGILTLVNTSGAGLEFSLDGSNYQASPTFENLFPMSYAVTARDANGCEVEETVNLSASPQLSVQMATPLLPCDGSGVTLAPQVVSGGNADLTYLWSDGSAGSQLEVTTDGIYLVAISNACETITTEVNVTYEDETHGNYLYIPNAFSPNGDGYNDKFRAFPTPDIDVLTYDFYVFDRWGNHIYEAHSVDEGWDGRFNNKTFNTGVYVYYIRANIASCGRTFEIFKKGDVTITN